MVVWAVIVGVVMCAMVVLLLRRDIKETTSDRTAGITRLGTLTLQDKNLQVRGVTHRVTAETHAEVVGEPQTVRRSTATRVVAGGAIAGPVGALAGHAAKKKRTEGEIQLLIDGDDWAEAITVSPKSYADAVRFAQAINLAARRR